MELSQRSLEKKLRRAVWNAVEDFSMIENGDKVMVCLSGGKDSYTMLDTLMHMQKYGDVQFDIVAVNLDQKQPGFPEEVLPNYLTKIGVEYKVLEKDTYSVVKEKVPEGKTTCSLCSRLRRGNLYAYAEEINATKIALGHHRGDILETFFLNLFFGGKLEAMPPKFKTDDGKHIVIRPLAYCKEEDIIPYSELKEFPIIPCNLCGSQPNLQRQVIKNMIAKWDEQYPNRSDIMFKALQNVSPSHLLDQSLFDFTSIQKELELQ